MYSDNYYKELPQGYSQVYCIDAKNKKTAVLFTVFSIVLSIAFAVPFFLDFSPSKVFNIELSTAQFVFTEVGFILSMFAYIVLHELVHGLVYKIATHERLTFGLTLTVAYCGVPKLFVKRGPMLAAILAPFVSFSILFAVLLTVIEKSLYWYLIAFLFAVHFGGCIGDLYGTIYMVFFHRDKPMLINDTGPKQTFYCKF